MLFEKKARTRQLAKFDFQEECGHPKSSGVLKQNMSKHYRYLKQKINGKSKNKKVSVEFKPVSNFYNIENSKFSQNRLKNAGLFFCDELDMCRNSASDATNIWKSSASDDEILRNDMFPFKNSQNLTDNARLSDNDNQNTSESNLLIPSTYSSQSKVISSSDCQSLINNSYKTNLLSSNITPNLSQTSYADHPWTSKSSNLNFSDSESIQCITDYLNMINEQPINQGNLSTSADGRIGQCNASIYEDSLHSQEDYLSFEVNTIHPSESLYSTNTNITPDFPFSEESSNYNHVHEINSNFSSISGTSIENLIEQIFDIPSNNSNSRNISSIYFEMTIDILETTSPIDGKFV